MKAITGKQRRNAERELTSVVCAGCDGPKERGYPFCPQCTTLMISEGWKGGNQTVLLLSSNLNQTAEVYTERLAWLLSPKGQRLRFRELAVETP